jgi:hypothetical protein
MGCAEIISFTEVRSSTQRSLLRQRLHERFDQWLDRLEQRLPESPQTLSEITAVIWELRQRLTGSLAETLIDHQYAAYQRQTHTRCPRCRRRLTSRGLVARTVETMVGPLRIKRPYFYCRHCHGGVYPCDEALELAKGAKHYDVQQAAAKLATEMPYDTASTLFNDLSGVSLGTERMHSLTNAIAEGLGVLDVAPSSEDVARTIARIRRGQHRRPIMVLAIDGAHVPTRPDAARGRRPGRKRYRAKRPRWRGQWREAKGFRCYLLDGDRVVHVLSWHQVQDDQALAEALDQVKHAGLIPEDAVRLCVVADGARWIWKHVEALFPSALHILDYYHCAEHVHEVAKAQYGESLHAQEWAEATLTRLFWGKVGHVIRGLQRMQAVSGMVAKVIKKLIGYLSDHRERLHYGTRRRAGYPIGSGGIESSNKFICHVRLKRSGAWWYEANSNQILALRCAKYNGTLEQVFARHRQRQHGASE